MEQVFDVYSYTSLVLLCVIIIVDVILLFRFRQYYRAHGFGVVTCILLNLVSVQALASLIYGATALIILITGRRYRIYVTLFHNAGTSWLVSSTLLHAIAVTCLRIYSISYGNRFLKFVKSKFNVCLVVIKLWFVSLALTLVTITSGTPTTYSVFYIGLAATGLFAVMAFFCTIETSSDDINQSITYSDEALENVIIPRNRQQNFNTVRNPQKTFAVFTGIIISFFLFTLPVSIPNLYFTLGKTLLSEPISLLVSLWCLVGVLVNSVWILVRLRSTVNNVTGFYSKWTLEGHHQDDTRHYVNESEDTYPKRHSFASGQLMEEKYIVETEDEII